MIEIRVREVTRYIVTRYVTNESGAFSDQCGGDIPSAEMADDVAGAVFERANSAGMAAAVEYSDGSIMSSAKEQEGDESQP